MRVSGDVAAYWAAVAFGALTIVLVGANYFVLSSNQTIQVDANQRQQFINQSTQLKRADDLLIRTLAQAAISAKDDKLRDLLAQQGVTMTPPASEPAPGSAPGAATGGAAAGGAAAGSATAGGAAASPAAPAASDGKAP
jgi:hypothetical protein